LAASLLGGIVLALIFAGVALGLEEACRPSLVERQRYGFVAVSSDWPQNFDVDSLQAGWYVDFQPYGSPPGGMDRALMIRVRSDLLPNLIQLGALVDDNPGAIWLVGNEPDCIWQDDVWPEEYARIYHDLYTFIKGRDLTSQVAAGGIVQPTPLRLEYLDRVLAAYKAQYGKAMPVDIWHIHNAILNEQRGGWGADIPPGIDAEQGVIRAIDDNDNVAIFEDQIWAFRQWLAENGYTGYPVIVTEYGVLMPKEYGFTEARVKAFMTNTFQFLSSTTDLALGDPSDGYRLVQRWAWFSLDVQPWDEQTGEGFNGNLFDPFAGSITTFGLHYADQTSSFPPLNYVDLGLATRQMPQLPLVVSPTQAVTIPVEVRVVNGGTADSGSFGVRLTYDGPVSDAPEQVIANLPPSSSEWITFTLTDLPVGNYALLLEIDPDGQVDESAECNNQATWGFVVPRYRWYAPLALVRSGVSASQKDGIRAVGDDQSAIAGTAGVKAPPGERAAGFVEWPVPAAANYPAQIALHEGDGALAVWVTGRDGNGIACFDSQAEGWDTYQVPGSQPWGLALDEDANVWFAETAADKIGKLIAASGTISEYVVTAGSQPWGVALDGSGMVWFTERAGDRLGQLDPATGNVIEYPLTAGAQPGGIAAYGDYVWFAETGINKLGRFKISTGEIREFASFPPNPPLVGPQDVAVISPGNPWLTEMEGNKITLFYWSTLQNFYPIAVHTPDSEPYGIAVEGSEAVWFTERAANKLGRYGRYSVSGLLFEYPLPTPGSLPTDVAVDSAGCAWYAAPGANRIGRLCRPENSLTYLPLTFRGLTSQ
jgi:streptogramin lyase